MLIDLDCGFSIIGHSERRSLFYENDNLINKKIAEYQHEFDEFEKWAEAESQKDAYIQGYSEEHIKQMQDPRHNQWGSAGEPKKTRVQ